MFKGLLDKPFKLISIIGCFYVATTIIINLFTGFSFQNSYYPFSKTITFITESIVFVLFALTYFFYKSHYLYFTGMEILVFSNLYTGNIYTALFISSILLTLLLTENKVISKKIIITYSSIEILKLLIVLPYGVTELFSYVGLTLFTLCTIGCINLLFRHAYTRNDTTSINLDDLKLSDRQKDCIKEIVLNNITIKALAIKHNVSESAIKKDLAHIYKIFGITGKADLKALFIGYQF